MAPSPGALLYWLLAATWPSSPTWELQPAIGRHQRRLLTRILNSSCTREATAWDPVECLGPWSRPQLENRRPRIGEAANPGPPAPGTPVGGERPYGRRPLEERPSMDVDSGGNAGRVYCPVPACPCGDPRRARGWASDATMRPHIDAHLSGALCGEVPAQWLQARGRQRCAVCGLSVSICSMGCTLPAAPMLARLWPILAACAKGMPSHCLPLTRFRQVAPPPCDMCRGVHAGFGPVR